MSHPQPPNIRPNDVLQSSDDLLLTLCTRETFRGTGPGGQKRNKTSSAVRITHSPTGISASAQEDRSQSKNLQLALRRLRFAIAHQLRRPGQHAADILINTPNWLDITPKHPDRPLIVALLFDVLDTQHWSLHQSAAQLNTTTAQLSRFLTADPDTHAQANTHRARRNLRPLRG